MRHEVAASRTQPMNPHALSVLEYARAVDVVASRATSEPGAAFIRALHPHTDRATLEREHARVAAVRALRGSDGGWGPEPVPVIHRAFATLRVIGASWNASDAQEIAVLLGSAARTLLTTGDPRRPAIATAMLGPILSRITAVPTLERAIAKVLSEDGAVRDDASPALRQLRREYRGAEQKLVRALESVMSKLDTHQQVADASVTVRNGRYVIPVRRGGHVALGGIVHDTSATGMTVFVEPPAAIEAANRIRELEIEIQREIDRILLELTDSARPHAESLVASHEALTVLDALYARARFGEEFHCGAIRFAEPGEAMQVFSGRHPLLLAQGVDVVAFDLQLDANEHTLLVSGPNTGGKTVLLKAIGLFHALAQSGIPIPVADESVIPLVDDIFADVGDEQSLQASLSTFSAHLKNQREILMAATPASLVLIDELGSGTDPAEGAALGASILEELTRRGTRTLASTHLGALKDLALEVPGVVNASLQFDEAILAPTYRLLKGIPGRSYGISIARRLALPENVIERAIARVPEQERAVSALLAELELRETTLRERESQLAADEEATRERGRRISDREQSVRAREKAAEREARQEARRHLLDARAEVERVLAEVRAAASVSANDAADERVRAARRALETGAETHASALVKLDRAERRVDEAPLSTEPLSVGDAVLVATLGGKTGRLVELRGDDGIVTVGGLKLTVPLRTLQRSRNELPKGAIRVPIMGDTPEIVVKTEVDLRGNRPTEIDDPLYMAVDAAIAADLKSLRIIHGKGTGALRERVAELLRKDTRIAAFRLGLWNEGGAGVTIAEFA
jgi:DNA mismatch repair protein MutS2